MIDIERFSEPARFVRDAVEAGAHFLPPPLTPGGRQIRKSLDWGRNVDITLTYYFGKFEGKDNNRSFPYEEVGKIFPSDKGPLTRERVRQIVTKTVEELYSNCPAEVQAQYDLDILKTQIGKPKFITSEEGTTRSIADDVEAGQEYKYLRDKYSMDYLCATRSILSPYGVIVPISESRANTNLLIDQLKTVDDKTDKETLRQLQRQINLSFMIYHKDLYHKYFIGLTNLLREIGFHFAPSSGSSDLFLEKMNEFDTPFGHIVKVVEDGPQKGEQNYYFVFRTQKEAVTQDLLPDADLAKFLHNPIMQISGIEVNRVPNTNDLEKRENFRSVLPLCRELKIRVGGQGFKVEDLLENCPIPVFRYTRTGGKKLRRRYFYPVTYQKHLADFLLEHKAK